MKKFDNYSKYYDLFNKDKNYKQEADYVLNLISSYMPTATTLVEFGCGTAQHAIYFATKYSIHGVDLSSSMLEEASKRLRENNIDENKFKLICGDIQTVNLNKKFDVCLSLFHVMSYMQSNDQILAVFKNARKHLNEDGLFIFDCWYGPAVLKQRPSQRIKKFNTEESQLIRYADPELVSYENKVNVRYQILELNIKNSQYSSVEETHPMRYFFEPELKLFSQLSGFEMVQSNAWLTNQVPTEENWGACYILRAI